MSWDRDSHTPEGQGIVTGEFRLETATAADFATLVGEEFAVAVEESQGPVSTLHLTEAVAHPIPNWPFREPFALFFEGTVDHALPQQIVWLTHDKIGTQGIFIVPVSDDGKKRRYQAVFN